MGGGQSLRDRRDHYVRVSQDVVIPKPQDTKAVCVKPSRTRAFGARLDCVLPAIDFDDQSSFETREIANVRAKRNLAAKAKAVHLAPP